VRSLTLRLALLFAAVSLVVMAAVGLHLYHVLGRELAARDQTELDGKVELARNLLREFDSLRAVVDASKRWQEVFVGHHGMHFKLLDPQGRPLVETSDWEADPSLVRRVLATRTDEAGSSEWQDADGTRMRVTAAWAPVGSTGERALIVLAREQGERIDLLRSHGLHVIIAVALGALATLILGFAVSRTSLRSVRDFAAMANDITASDLDRRLDVASAPEELKTLAVSFNRMLERLQDSFRRLSDFSSDIAHDIRTPINNLLGQTQVALGRPRSADELREVLESNVEEYERMARMVDDMLFLARADNAQAVLQRSAFDLRQEVEKVLAFFEPLSDERAITTRVEGDATLHADRTMIQRMLGNLLSNALRHSPQGGTILVQIRSNPDGSVEFAVSNAGEPIPAEHLPRLFDRFYRADAARSSSGTGLGLAIVKSIAELHGGHASATSTHSEGTRFAIYLPPISATDAAAQEPRVARIAA
jgi:two-component system heavy metal sensor histidine kinase CusS